MQGERRVESFEEGSGEGRGQGRREGGVTPQALTKVGWLSPGEGSTQMSAFETGCFPCILVSAASHRRGI